MNKLILYGFTCLLFLAAGCTETKMLYHGNTVSSVPVVALQENTAIADRWETFDLIIDYEYIKNDDNLTISGKAYLSLHYQQMYTNIPRMDTYIFFLDENSQVLETATLVNLWSNNTQESQDFSGSYKIPGATKKLSFGYSGDVLEVDDESSLYELPLN